MFFKLFVFLAVCIYGISCERDTATIEAIAKSCIALRLKHMNSIFSDVDYFVENGELPAGRGNCIFKCVFMVLDVFDSDSGIDIEKLKKVRKTGKLFKKFLGVFSDTALHVCGKPTDTDDIEECENAYNLAECAVDLARRKPDSTTRIMIASRTITNSTITMDEHEVVWSTSSANSTKKMDEHELVRSRSSATEVHFSCSLHFLGAFFSIFYLINKIVI